MSKGRRIRHCVRRSTASSVRPIVGHQTSLEFSETAKDGPLAIGVLMAATSDSGISPDVQIVEGEGRTDRCEIPCDRPDQGGHQEQQPISRDPGDDDARDDGHDADRYPTAEQEDRTREVEP